MDINKCVELYKLMADRCSASGFCEEQGRVYNEMVDLIKDCSNIEESMEKIKNSPYYLAPSAALIKDKINAWIRAAQENGMDDVVEVYKAKLAKIDADQNEMYIPGYETEAQNLKSKYILTMQAFSSVFNSYITYIATRDVRNVSDIINHLQKLSKPWSDFGELAKLEQFRALIPLNDNGYSQFVSEIENLQKTGELNVATEISGDVEQSNSKNMFSLFRKKDSGEASVDNLDELFNEAKQNSQQIKEISNTALTNIGKSQVTVNAPEVDIDQIINKKTTDMKYTFSDEKVI